MTNPFRRFARGTRCVLVLVAALSARPPSGVSAQSLPVGDVLEEYLRVLQVAGIARAGSFQIRPFPVWEGLAVGDSAAHPWASAIGRGAPPAGDAAVRVVVDPARVRAFVNSATPFPQNDGAVWQGKGITLAAEGGATATLGPLGLTLHPVLVYAQNADFDVAPVTRAGAGPYAYPWRQIDLPQRPGPDAYTRLDPGESTASLRWGGAMVGFSTRNLWWGPGLQTSILMSNHAPGFPHAFLGTARPVDVRIGTFEGNWIWGRLQESGWYEEEDAGLGRFFTGAAAVFSPSIVPGLSLGGARVFVRDIPEDGLALGDYLVVLEKVFKVGFQTSEDPKGNDENDQIASFFARYVLPGSGFEVYAEWARNDHALDLRDLLTEPEHSLSYTFGFQKVSRLARGRLLSVSGELTNLELSRTYQIRGGGGGSLYAHWLVLRGYTNRGQVIGSLLGPGGSGEHLGADVYEPWGRWGFFVQRQAHDNDHYYTTGVRWGNDVSLSAGSRVLVRTRGLEVGLEGVLTRELNRYFVPYEDLWNLHVGIAATWRPR